MKVTVLTADERIVSLDVEPDELVLSPLFYLSSFFCLPLSLSCAIRTWLTSLCSVPGAKGVYFIVKPYNLRLIDGETLQLNLVG
jgi:hypothetical protein